MAQGEGREVTRVTNTGVVKVVVSIMTKNMEGFGYSTGNGNAANAAVGSFGGGSGNVMASTTNFSVTQGFNITSGGATPTHF